MTTAIQYPVGIPNSITDTIRRLFYDEVRAGMVLSGLFVLYTTMYMTMLIHGYAFVEDAIIHYSLVFMGLIGGFALGVGLLRRWGASMGISRPHSG